MVTPGQIPKTWMKSSRWRILIFCQEKLIALVAGFRYFSARSARLEELARPVTPRAIHVSGKQRYHRRIEHFQMAPSIKLFHGAFQKSSLPVVPWTVVMLWGIRCKNALIGIMYCLLGGRGGFNWAKIVHLNWWHNGHGSGMRLQPRCWLSLLHVLSAGAGQSMTIPLPP